MEALALPAESPLIQLFLAKRTTKEAKENVYRDLGDRITQSLSRQDLATLSQLNRAWNQKFARCRWVRGSKNKYALLKTLTRKDVGEILDQTGYWIRLRAGEARLQIATSIDEKEDLDKRVLGGREASGVFCIGYALNLTKTKTRYVGIKIAKEDANWKEEQKAQQGLRGVSLVIPEEDSFKATDAQGHVLRGQVMDIAGLGSAERIRYLIHQLPEKKRQEELVFLLAEGLLEGLRAMHERTTYHLDIKLDNIVVSENGDVKLIDFGVSKLRHQGKISGLELSAGGAGTHASPERHLATYNPNALCDGDKIDAWAAGVVLLELMCSDQRLYPDSKNPVFFDHLKIGDWCSCKKIDLIEDYIAKRIHTVPELRNPSPESYWAVVRELLIFNPDKRINVAQALERPWFVNMRQQTASYKSNILQYLKELVHASSSEIDSSPQDPPYFFRARHVNRLELQEELKKRLRQPEGSFTVCQGLPGMGKTHLVNAIFHDEEWQKERIGLKLWFRNADSPTQLAAQYLKLAQELNLLGPQMMQPTPGFSFLQEVQGSGLGQKQESHQAFGKQPSSDDAIGWVRRYLSLYQEKHGKSFLMAFDNANDPKTLESYLPKGGHILVTSRSTEWTEPVVHVDKLTPSEGTNLVQGLLSAETSNQEVRLLCEQFAYIPLALLQACAYIRNQELTITASLDRLRHSQATLDSPQSLDGIELPCSITALYQLILEELKKTKAFILLRQIACLAADRIPKGLILDLIDHRGSKESMPQSDNNNPIVPPSLASPHSKVNLLTTLVDYAVLQQTSAQTYLIHPLMQQMVRQQSSLDEMGLTLMDVMQTLSAKYQHEPSSIYVRSNRELLMHGETVLAITKATFPYEPYSKEVKKKYPSGLKEPLAKVLAWVIHESTRFDSSGDWQKVRTLIQPALELVEEVWTESNPELAESLWILGYACGDRNAVKAKEYFSKALRIAQGIHGEGQPETAKYLHGLGSAWLALDDRQEARRYFNESIRIKEAHGTRDSDLAIAYSSLAMISSVGVAKQQLEKAVGILEEVCDEGHPVSLTICNNVAQHLLYCGQKEDGVKRLKEAVDTAAICYGGDHPVLITPLNNLVAALLWDCTDPKAAEPYCRELLRLCREYLSIDDRAYGRALKALGYACFKLNKLAESQSLLEAYYDFSLRQSDNAMIADSAYMLGAALWLDNSQHNKKRGEQLLKEGYRTAVITLGLRHPSTQKYGQAWSQAKISSCVII